MSTSACKKRIWQLDRERVKLLISVQNISFIESTLSYKKDIPNQGLIKKYDLRKHDFTIINGEPRVNMILGGQEFIIFKILEECTWKYGPACHALTGDHLLGPIFGERKLAITR